MVTHITAVNKPAWILPAMEATVKSRCILQACTDHDVQELRKLAASRGGLLKDELRREACQCAFKLSERRVSDSDGLSGPLLLGSVQDQGQNAPDWTSLAKHRDEDQVQLDVDRSFVYYPSGIATSACRHPKRT